jgi:hypothetical protein
MNIWKILKQVFVQKQQAKDVDNIGKDDLKASVFFASADAVEIFATQEEPSSLDLIKYGRAIKALGERMIAEGEAKK